MPELPEVETVMRGLQPHMEGALIERVEQRRADLRFPFPDKFVTRLQGAEVHHLSRRAKYVLVGLSTGEILVMHLGMSGRFLVNGQEESPHDHVVFYLSNGDVVTYNDPRRFGYMALVEAAAFDEHKFFGFRGGSFMSFQLYKSSNDQFYIHKNDIPHLANTYAAICILLMLGDDLERVNKQRIIDGLKYFQNEDGRIRCLVEDSEDDVRFAYCAAAVHYILTTIQGISQEPSFDAQNFIDYSKQ